MAGARAGAPAPAPFLQRGSGKLGPLCGPSDIRVALVSTLRDVEDQFLQWLEWFRLIGFAHLFLYFDDPDQDEAAIAAARSTYSGEFVSFALNSPELRKEWMSLRSWEKFSPFTDDRMCRQLLNIAHALKRAREPDEAVDWMFHLDHDELFLPPPHGLQAHFQHLEAGNCRLCLYQNFEAAPQSHTLTPFLDVSYFKVPSGRVSKTPLGAAGMEFWAQRTKAHNYFLYYDNGKSAVKIPAQGSEDIAPTSVHVLYPPNNFKEFIVGNMGWTTFAEHELFEMNLTWMKACHDEIVVGAKVLHYPATHFERLWRKYHHLGNFPAVRFGGELVVPASFHLEARDEYLKYSDKTTQQEKLKELLERAAFLSDEEVQSQLETGSVVSIDTVRESLRQGVWIPPRQLRPSLFSLLQRRPSKEAMERMQRMRRMPAEVLFEAVGLLKMESLDQGLQKVVEQLETRGWAACHLGLHGKLMDRARLEASQLKPKMSKGATVIENRVVDPTESPNALRGDWTLFMQEQGLTGPKGPAPTLTMLESALTDLGMQLDPRWCIQRSFGQCRWRWTSGWPSFDHGDVLESELGPPSRGRAGHLRARERGVGR
ncbi:unnamed protein product [Durusdinium trenchii]|uniref:Glycosyltransferase family 92 protein n=1 Tax=Durusdinium trenchii TaxID=1381693 RepID=A0ABP0JWI1_9DINO